MASWTNEIWERTEIMMEQGTQVCRVPKNTLFINCTKDSSAKNLGVSKNKNDFMLHNPGKPYRTVKHNLTSHHVKRVRIGNGFLVYPNAEVIDLMERSRKEQLYSAKEILVQYEKKKTRKSRSAGLPAMQYAEIGR